MIYVRSVLMQFYCLLSAKCSSCTDPFTCITCNNIVILRIRKSYNTASETNCMHTQSNRPLLKGTVHFFSGVIFIDKCFQEELCWYFAKQFERKSMSYRSVTVICIMLYIEFSHRSLQTCIDILVCHSLMQDHRTEILEHCSTSWLLLSVYKPLLNWELFQSYFNSGKYSHLMTSDADCFLFQLFVFVFVLACFWHLSHSTILDILHWRCSSVSISFPTSFSSFSLLLNCFYVFLF